MVGPEEPTLEFPIGKASISFPIPVANPGKAGVLSLHRLKPDESETAECPGIYQEPKAEPGNFCIYTNAELDVGPPENIFVDLTSESSGEIYPGAFIFSIEGKPGGFAQGSWAVTAP